MDKIIDFRVRPPYKSFKSDWFFGGEVLEGFKKQSGRPVGESAKQMSMELFLEELDKCNIAHAVITGRPGYGSANPDIEGVRNQDVAELVEQYPDRFTGVISVDTTDCEAALAEIDKYVVNGSCKGVAIEPAFAKGPARWDDKSLYPIYKKCEQVNAFVILTTGVMYDKLSEADPVAFDNVAVDFPNLRIVISHGGWPYVIQTIWVALKRNNVWLLPDFYMYESPGRTDFVYAINTMLREKMMYASAYPLVSLETAVECNMNCGIKEEVLPDFMYNNAAKFLGLNK